MSFEDFKRTIERGIERGEIQTEQPLTELEIAIQYAIGSEQEERGTEQLTLTVKDICLLVLKHCGADVYHRVLPA